ncbi:MAE_28990/MAE_18760 family HEPN-like nuclease [Ponticoccus litoralis]|uniref:MAE_28990/MAE_18760 family HEPN-like nuclease n=1 Tax=Ponticoccus litoralis TaxID=422297 RepID=UPI003D2EAAE2
MFSFETIASNERARRARSLSNSRALFIGATEPLKEVAAQSLIVMCYAHWEGFFNYCVDLYIKAVNSAGKNISQINPALLACEIEPHLMSLRDRNFRIDARPDFARQVFALSDHTKITSDHSILKAASNLDFKRLRNCLSALDVDEGRLLQHQNFIVHELVKWRHQVAHGDEPDLGSADLIAHSHRAEELLIIVLEVFSDRVARF